MEYRRLGPSGLPGRAAERCEECVAIWSSRQVIALVCQVGLTWGPEVSGSRRAKRVLGGRWSGEGPADWPNR